MNNHALQLIDEAFHEGAYRVAFDLSSNAINTGAADGITYLYRVLSEIGMADLSSLDIKGTKANVSFAFRHLCQNCKTVRQAESLLDDSLTMCISLANSLKNSFESADESLKRQYQGSVGISFDSDDPAEKAKRDRERAFNNGINMQRNNLKENYENIVASLFETALQTAIHTDILLVNKHMVSLKFVEHLEIVTYRVDEVTERVTKTFAAAVRKARNEHYWSQNAERHKALTSEKKQLEENVSKTIAIQLAKLEETKKEAIEIKEDAVKKRKRYSLFNFTDRRPQSAIIATAKAIIKKSEEFEKKLKAGICELCEPDRKRIAEIDKELSMQR